MRICPVCGGSSFQIAVDARRLQEECRVRQRFVSTRLTRDVDPDELKDLTDFFHAERAELLQCRDCTLLIREEHEPPPAQEYSEDEYDPEVIEHQYPQYVDAFRKKEIPYRSLLPPRSHVLEVGSHYGAFLQVAGEWEWRAEGVDPGKDTSRFAKSKGFIVHVAALEQMQFPPEHFDAVFIWNCFEQMEDPKPTLDASRRILKPNGVFTVRTPNGLFYLACEKVLCDEAPKTEAKDFLVRAMGYNNLLGFPYLYGHSEATLTRLIEPHGFQREGSVNSELLTYPLPENPAWVEREEETISADLKMLENYALADQSGTSMAPWIEVWFRAT